MSGRGGKTVSRRGPSKPMRVKSDAIHVQVSLLAPHLSPTEAAEYVREAVTQFSGCLAADDPRRHVRVTRVWRLGWIDVDDAEVVEE